MKIYFENFGVTDNSNECDEDTFFLKTKQNQRFEDEVAKKNPKKILTQKELIKELGLDTLKVVAITGTNGKTTTAAAIYSILLDLGFKTALLGTRGFFINDKRVKGKGLTTPTSIELIFDMFEAKKNGCEYFIMEASSHAIEQERIGGIDFALKIFTNITQDHLDYHKTMEEYLRVKSSFFADETPKLINKDDTKILFNPKGALTYAVEASSTFTIKAYSLKDGISALIAFGSCEEATFSCTLYGLFNLYNLTAAIGAVKMLTDLPLEKICECAENFGGVAGRMEVVNQEPLVIVDFAHTPDGMEKVLDSIRDKDITVVFGAGGDRDRLKRPLMGRVAQRFAKKIIITSDNPRSENPSEIANEIMSGITDFSNVTIQLDRKKAIEKGLEGLGENEVLMILGKGDEETQEICGTKHPFDDRKVTREILKNKIS